MAPLASSLAARVPWTLLRPAEEWRLLPLLPRGRRGQRRSLGPAEVAAAGLPALASCGALGFRPQRLRCGPSAGGRPPGLSPRGRAREVCV